MSNKQSSGKISLDQLGSDRFQLDDDFVSNVK